MGRGSQFQLGGELMRETLTQPFGGMPHPSNSVSRFNNGAPSEVRIYQSPSRSENGMWTTGVYANDTWQVTNRMTVNLGIRFDRFRGFRPKQEGPGGAAFAEADSPVVWKNWGPRLGISYDLTGNGKTVVKANFGQYWLGPAADFTADINPNAPMWYRQYAWSDINGSGVWEPGEEGRLISAVGGSTSTAFDESLKNSFTRQVTAYLERELVPNLGVRTGFVWNGRRDFYAQINQSRPLLAYNVPVPVTDPGPDGRTGTADDASLTAYNLASDFLAASPVNVVTQLEQADSDFYTWEIAATKRDTGRWSMMASFAHTWSSDRAIGTTTSYTPNALINTDDGRNRSTSWQGKLNATLSVGWNLFVTPIFRYQSGTNFGRTFVATLNYGTATILAEPFDAERTPNIALFDVRTEKGFSFGQTRLSGFFDVYNIFNTNAEQAVATQTGSTFLRPVAITPPRIARVGIKFQW